MIFNSRNKFYKTPLGAVAKGTELCFRVVLERPLLEPILQLYADGEFDTPMAEIALTNESQCADQNTYICRYTIAECGIYFYRFCTRHGEVIGRSEHSTGRLDSDSMWQITVYNQQYITPSRFYGQVFYQIFPDRFYYSGREKALVPTDRKIHLDWYSEPVSTVDEDGEFRCNDYFCGDLQGIIEKLDYIQSLGVYGIYLNPIFEAHSNHRYNTADYLKIDPLLGTEKDFSTLCNYAHKRGMAVILDGVFNHTGSDSVYFNREGRYGIGGAYRDISSPYRSWYNISAAGEYDSWWGFETLPNVNEDSESYKEFICGESGVLRHWLRLGADGFRLDVADELPDSFIEDIRQAVKAEKPDALLLGEVWEDASNKFAYGRRRKYFLGEQLDSVMNYPWRTAILDFIRHGKGMELLQAICTIIENYPKQSYMCALNSLSTHDVPRAITALAAESMDGKSRDWQREHNHIPQDLYAHGRQLFMLASVIQFTLPGCPCIYYGDEAGLYGYADPFNRGTYPWHREDTGLVEFFKLLGQLRKGSKVLRLGEFLPVWFDEKTCVYIREYLSEKILVAVNRSCDELKIMHNKSTLTNAKLLLSVGECVDNTVLKGYSAVVLGI